MSISQALLVTLRALPSSPCALLHLQPVLSQVDGPFYPVKLKIPAASCRKSPECMEVCYCNSLAPLNPFGRAKRNLTGRANPCIFM
jgi:hypothetical protein